MSTRRLSSSLTGSRHAWRLQDESVGLDGSPYRVVRRHGLGHLLQHTAQRLRFADGFSHARALAFQLCLAVVPFLIGLTGLADEIGAGEGGRVIAYTTLGVTPGRGDELTRELLLNRQGDEGEVALLSGLAFGLIALVAAVGQIERGANRLYDVARDRPAATKYVRALLVAVLAGVPAFVGFLLVVAGKAFDAALERVYGWGTLVERIWAIAHLPVALVLTLGAITVIFRFAPRRRQPRTQWLLPGVALATAAWIGTTLLLALYVNSGLSFSRVYGPLAGVMALLLWANLSAVALLFGIAFAAQLEACQGNECRTAARKA